MCMSVCLFVCASSESGVLWCACLSVCLSVRHLRAEYCVVFMSACMSVGTVRRLRAEYCDVHVCVSVCLSTLSVV